MSNTNNFKEKNMHSLFAKYLLEQSIYPKTINANKSKTSSKGDNEWVHPDIVSVKFNNTSCLSPSSSMEKFMSISVPQIEVASYELKLSLALHELKEKYFQAVSNSSWANLGYLVVFDIKDSEDMKNELRRLNQSFGIGVLVFNKEAISNKKINYNELFQIYENCEARYRDKLDVKFIEKLISNENKDFQDFLAASYSLNDSLKGSDSLPSRSIITTYFDNCKNFDEDLSLAKDFCKRTIDTQNQTIPECTSSDFKWFTDNWKNLKFEKIVFQNEEYFCSSTAELYVTICSILYQKNNNIFLQYNSLSEESKTKEKLDFSLNKGDLRMPKIIPNSPFYAETNNNNNNKRDKLKKLLLILKIDVTDFQVFVIR